MPAKFSFDVRVAKGFPARLGEVQYETDGRLNLKKLLAEALQKLKKDGPDAGAPHGVLGDYEVPLGTDYLLIYSWETERDEQKRPLADHVYLLTIKKVAK
ncbi:MAG TPA: hypothetical protein VGF06_05365 [Terriglobales bacterium]